MGSPLNFFNKPPFYRELNEDGSSVDGEFTADDHVE